jgi:hypothetical protein
MRPGVRNGIERGYPFVRPGLHHINIRAGFFPLKGDFFGIVPGINAMFIWNRKLAGSFFQRFFFSGQAGRALVRFRLI